MASRLLFTLLTMLKINQVDQLWTIWELLKTIHVVDLMHNNQVQLENTDIAGFEVDGFASLQMVIE